MIVKVHILSTSKKVLISTVKLTAPLTLNNMHYTTLGYAASLVGERTRSKTTVAFCSRVSLQWLEAQLKKKKQLKLCFPLFVLLQLEG